MSGQSLGEKLFEAIYEGKHTGVNLPDDLKARWDRVALAFASSLTHDEAASAVIAGLRGENEQLRLAICGGEDAPGYAASRPLQTILDVAEENQSSWLEETELRMEAEAKVTALTEEVEALKKELASRDPQTDQCGSRGDLAVGATAALATDGLQDAMAQLYAAEINCGMASFWDSGWIVWIGDAMNGRKAEEGFWPEHLIDVPEWLLTEAEALYPAFKRRAELPARQGGAA